MAAETQPVDSVLERNLLEIEAEAKALSLSPVLVDKRQFRPYKTSDEYLFAVKEDLAYWLNNLYQIGLNPMNFMDKLDTGVQLCEVS
jgi:hypothetical protein